jgi:C-terminal processing protease CtpA/Prc
LPELGKVVWRSDRKRFSAYAFEAKGGPFGYVRLGDYGAGGAEAVARIADFDAVIDAFVARGVKGIVLDQLGNGGGNYVFALSMLSRLSRAPLVSPTQRFEVAADGALAAFPDPAAIQPLVSALTGIDDEAGARRAQEEHPLLAGPLAYLSRDLETFREVRDFFGFVLAEGRSAGTLTPPHYQVVRAYRPDPRRGAPYTGRLVLLIDELNLSAAEYTAAALGDAGRALLFGATTSGAGGDQRWWRAKNVCGGEGFRADGMTPCVPPDVAAAMKAHGVAGVAMTVTLGYRLRPDGALGAPIENEGVPPHVPYEVTAEDLSSDYAPMRAAILTALAGAGQADSTAF